MTNYSERLDELLLTTLREMSRELEAYGYLDSKNYLPEKREAITSLMKELVAEAKEQLPTSEQLTTKYGYHVPGKIYGYKLGLHDAREALDQFEQNLLKALEDK